MSAAEFEARGGEQIPPEEAAAYSLRNGKQAAPCGGLRYVSPWAWRAEVNDVSGVVTVIPPVGAAIYFNIQSDRMTAIPAGVSGHRDYRIQFLNDSLTPCALENASLISFVSADGSKVRFSIDNGDVVGMTSSSGKVISAEERQNQVICQYDDNHYLSSCYSPTEGLMQTHTAEDGAFVMEWYAPSAVTALGNGEYQTTGKPYKTSSYSVTEENGVKTVTMTRQQGELPPYTITRIEQSNLVTIIKGTGDETIIRTIETNQLYGNMSEIIESVRGINDATPVSCTRELKQNVNGTWLLISRTEAFNTEIAQTTTYEYNANLRIEKVTYHNGNYVEYEYDSMGRVTKLTRPWGDGGKKMTRNVYAANSSRFYDNRPIKVYTDYEDATGKFLNLAVTDYIYEDSAEVERVTATTYAAGVNHQQVTIDDTYGESAVYSYAAGKPKFRQAINGVQTWHDYEETSEHGAVHKHTVTTKANGELVAAQSRKTETFIAVNETTTFEQDFIWDGENWLLLNTAAYEYDEEKRVAKLTRGNGRFSTTEWMCCGKLSETNEDGITTSYGYNSAHQLVETIRSEVKDGEVVVTSETITSYTYDAAGRTLSVRRDIGAMTTTESTEYDLFGRVIKQIDVLGRETATDYSADGLTSTVTTPAGATFVTTSNPDGSTKEISGTGQRAQQYSYDINGKNIATTVRLMNNAILSQNIVNGFGQTVVQTSPATNNRFIYTRSEYNSKGQMIKQYQDTGWNTTSTAPNLYEYEAFGNVVKQTIALSDTPTKDNSPVVELSYAVESLEDGIYSTITRTRYNVAGDALTSEQKQMISALSPTIESKSVSINERILTSTQWSIYNTGTKRTTYSNIPTSTITAETVTVDGFVVFQKDNAGITSTAARAYATSGMTLTHTDGRGNATTTATDIAGRAILMTDTAGNTTSTTYCTCCDNPATVTDAQGNTSCYRYDERGRKVAEWGMGIQPACFSYDDTDNLISLKTFRAGTEIISTDPSERMDGDETTWVFDPATGLELRKTYADNSSVVKTYNAYNRLATETDARGVVKTHSYEVARGLLLGTSYSDTTAARSYTYNHLGRLTQVTDDAGSRTLGYNAYGEQETDSLLAGDVTHLITETRDAMGRSTGFTYTKNDTVQHTVTTEYGTDGRIASAGFLHGGAEKQFGYSYLLGSNLLQTLTMPCNMTLTQSYETQRDLITGISYMRGTTTVVNREYSYDSLGRPTTRNTARNGQTINDTFGYNNRSELTSATVNNGSYSYDYDNIGNRETAQEASEEVTTYAANNLNQYTTIGDFSPTFDADGNQTLIKTSTGVWSVEYNAENRPIRFTSEDGITVIECTYDFMGRRSTKKVTTDGSITLNQRFIYRGYLQIACCDLTRSGHPCLWLITWDPTQPIATRPLAIRKDGTWFAYGWDLTKNICEVFGAAGYIRTAYTYTPYGEVSTSGDVTQPVQWSSEYNDIESNLIYYNYRYYNAIDGRWIGKDLIGEKDHNNLHVALSNAPCYRFDVLGETSCSCTIILYVDPPSMNAVENDVLNVGIDTGHTWLEVHDGSEIITFSVGPNGKIGKRDLDDFEAGTYDGVTDWETETHAASAVKKDWELTPCQCQKAKKLIEEKQKKGIKYTPTYQCTTAALELLNAIPVTPAPPDGVGNVVAKKGVYTAWSGRVANPYHLSKQLGASVQTNSTSSQKDKKAQK